MQNTMQRQILNALLVALRPLARALLRAGIGYREFAEISKSAFVDIATRDYGLRGRPTNISRVAVMTGLTRKEVRRLRDKSEAGEETATVRSTPMSTILHRWFIEDEFLDGLRHCSQQVFAAECCEHSDGQHWHNDQANKGQLQTQGVD